MVPLARNASSSSSNAAFSACAIIETLKSPEFRRRVFALPGYDTAESGTFAPIAQVIPE